MWQTIIRTLSTRTNWSQAGATFAPIVRPCGGHVGTLPGSFGANLGIKSGIIGDTLGIIFDSFWDHFGDNFFVILGSHSSYFENDLGSFWGHLGDIFYTLLIDFHDRSATTRLKKHFQEIQLFLNCLGASKEVWGGLGRPRGGWEKGLAKTETKISFPKTTWDRF